MESLDLVVVGAGWFGLAVAKTHHQLDPDSSLAILDSSSSIGGVWAQHRLYPGLKTNNMLGTYEYPDFPMDPDTFGVHPGDHIPGRVVHDYLTKYSERFGILDKIRCGCRVVSAELNPEGGWTLTVSLTGEPKESKILARRLVVATGLTSEPFLPIFSGQEMFGAPIFHVKDFLGHAGTIGKIPTVTVFGGTKSAWDMVYSYASKGTKVDWVIRESGHGPAWMAPPYVTPLKRWLEKLVHTRLLTWFSPCSWGKADGYGGIRHFLHASIIGRFITKMFWKVLGGDVLALNKYRAHPETAKLQPWSDPMFTASSFSILNYDTDFFDLVRQGMVRVHIADVTKLSRRTVHLSNGTELESSALCCATGWKHVPPLQFLPLGIERELGIPHKVNGDTFPSLDLQAEVNREINNKWPVLLHQPIQNKRMKPLLESDGLSTKDDINPSTSLQPFMLYRFMVPPSAQHLSRRDIVFAGMLMNFTVPMIAHVQAVWIEAFFRGQLPSLQGLQSDPETVARLRYETVLHSRFGQKRYPAGYGNKFPDFVFDAVPYIDWLVGDLGLRVHRKMSRLAEMLEPYGPEDYKDLIAEWTEHVDGFEAEATK